MANLTSALNYALAGLSVSAAQSALVARNVSSAGDANYTRKSAEVQTLPGGGPAVSGISRSTDRQLLDKLLMANAQAAAKQVGLDALGRMAALTGDPEDDQSIAFALGKLQSALQDYESNPASTVLGRTALEAARGVAQKLNAASDEVSNLIGDADKGLAESAQRITALLDQFKVVNDGVVRGQGTASELAEMLDQRDAILKGLSEEIGIRTALRPNNDVLIYAEGGAVLFEGSPRSVRFEATPGLTAGQQGNALFIDGVAVTGAGAPMPITSGKAAAFASLRDQAAPQLSAQLDQMAAGLIRAFAEKDAGVPPSLPEVQGLFTGGSGMPSLTAPAAGLAAELTINPLADPGEGGSVLLIRDGGFGGPAYRRNATGVPGFQARIAELADALDRAQSFGTATGIGGTVSLKAFSTAQASWIEDARQSQQKSLDAANATQTRAGDSLMRITGVNIDQEMAALLDLEKSYQASSKVIAIVDGMLARLMEAVGR